VLVLDAQGNVTRIDGGAHGVGEHYGNQKGGDGRLAPYTGGFDPAQQQDGGHMQLSTGATGTLVERPPTYVDYPEPMGMPMSFSTAHAQSRSPAAARVATAIPLRASTHSSHTLFALAVCQPCCLPIHALHPRRAAEFLSQLQFRIFEIENICSFPTPYDEHVQSHLAGIIQAQIYATCPGIAVELVGPWAVGLTSRSKPPIELLLRDHGCLGSGAITVLERLKRLLRPCPWVSAPEPIVR
jgi:hypothetical protein